MKIMLTEGQLKNLVNEFGRGRLPLPQEDIDKRLEKAKELAVNVSNPRQFELKYPNLYNFLKGQKLFDSVFPNRKKYKPAGFWTPENIAQEARKYNTKGEFENNNQVAYHRALKFGIIDDLFPESQYGAKKKYDLDRSIELAKNFDGGRSEFFIKYPTAYRILRDHDLLTSYFGVSKLGRKTVIFDDDLIKQAKEYPNTRELRLNNMSLYNKLNIRGLMNTVFPKVEMSDDEIIEKSKEYGNASRLNRENSGLYKKLKQIPNGLELAFADNKKELKMRKCMDIAKNFDNRYDLKRNNYYVFNYLRDNGILDTLFPVAKVDNPIVPNKIKVDKPKEISSLPKKKLKFGRFGSLENLTKWVAPYKRKKELERNNPLAYICVRENGLFDYFGLK